MPDPAPDPLAPYDPIFQAAGQEWNVDPLLLRSLAGQESSGNPKAVSKAGAQGLMGLMPDTAKGLGVTDPTDPVQNIFGGAKYLSQALDAEGSPELALLRYHGGPGWRQKYGDESKNYVPAVAARYKALLASQPAQAVVPPQAAVAPSDAAPTPSQQASP